jgi:hypothetical protein
MGNRSAFGVPGITRAASLTFSSITKKKREGMKEEEAMGIN